MAQKCALLENHALGVQQVCLGTGAQGLHGKLQSGSLLKAAGTCP